MIRRAGSQDASRLAEILVFAKRCAYRGIFRNDRVSFNELSVLGLGLRFRDEPEALEGMYVYDDGIVRGLLHVGEQCQGGRKAFQLRRGDPEGEGPGRGPQDLSAQLRGVL